MTPELQQHPFPFTTTGSKRFRRGKRHTRDWRRLGAERIEEDGRGIATGWNESAPAPTSVTSLFQTRSTWVIGDLGDEKSEPRETSWGGGGSVVPVSRCSTRCSVAARMSCFRRRVSEVTDARTLSLGFKRADQIRGGKVGRAGGRGGRGTRSAKERCSLFLTCTPWEQVRRAEWQNMIPRVSCSR